MKGLYALLPEHCYMLLSISLLAMRIMIHQRSLGLVGILRLLAFLSMLVRGHEHITNIIELIWLSI